MQQENDEMVGKMDTLQILLSNALEANETLIYGQI